MHIPKISVIVPVYKVEQYLPRCIDSILAQTFTEFELLLIDDGSPDNSGKICDEYAKKDNRIRVFHKENGGVSSARNLGLGEAKGEWVTFVDSDDKVVPHWLNSIKSKNTGNYDLFTWGNYVVKDGTHKSYVTSGITYLNSNTFIKSLDYRHTVWSYLFRTDWVKKHQIAFPRNIKYSEDQSFLLKYLVHNPRIMTLKESLYYYMLHSGSAVSKPITIQTATYNLMVATDFLVYTKEMDNKKYSFIHTAISDLFKSYIYYSKVSSDFCLSKIHEIYNTYFLQCVNLDSSIGSIPFLKFTSKFMKLSLRMIGVVSFITRKKKRMIMVIKSLLNKYL